MLELKDKIKKGGNLAG